MGHCGCADTNPNFQFPGPDGVTYAIQIYESCHYCHTPAAVDVLRLDDDEAAEWLDGVAEARFMSYSEEDPVNAQLSIPVVDPGRLVAAIEEVDDEGTAHISEVHARFALPLAVHQTLVEW